MRKWMLWMLLLGVVLFFAAKTGDTDPHMERAFLRMSFLHPCGTDNLGREVSSLLIKGCLRTLTVIFVSGAISFLLGVSLGMAAGYYGGWFESMVQFMADFSLVIPSFICALIVSALFGLTPLSAGLVFGIGNMGEYVNQAASLTRSLKKREFIEAEKGMGISGAAIMLKHIFPNIMDPLLTFMANKASNVSLQYASLAFIGLGTDITAPDWGTMLYQYRIYILKAPELVFWPAAAIFVLALFFHFCFEADGRKANGEVAFYE